MSWASAASWLPMVALTFVSCSRTSDGRQPDSGRAFLKAVSSSIWPSCPGADDTRAGCSWALLRVRRSSAQTLDFDDLWVSMNEDAIDKIMLSCELDLVRVSFAP